jgi:hypothetical protein
MKSSSLKETFQLKVIVDILIQFKCSLLKRICIFKYDAARTNVVVSDPFLSKKCGAGNLMSYQKDRSVLMFECESM